MRGALDRDRLLGSHAIHRAREIAPADREVHRAAEGDGVRHGQRFARQEDLHAELRARRLLGVFGRAAEPNRAERPIEEKHAVAVGRRKLEARRRKDSGGGRRSDFDRGRGGVRAPRRPLSAAGTPAVVDAAREFAHAGRAVPRQPHVPFHVAVEREGATEFVEREVVAVAEADGHQLPFRAVAIRADDPSARRLEADGVAVRIPDPRGDDVLLPHLRHARVGERGLRRRTVIAADDPQRAVGRENDLMRPVLAAVSCDMAEQLLVVVLAIAVGVAKPPQAAARRVVLVHDDEQIVVDREQSVRAADFGFDHFDFGVRRRRALLARRQREEPAVLRSGDQPAALLIDGQSHDRSARLRRDIDQLGDEALGRRNRAVHVALRRPAERGGGRIAPRRIAELAEDLDADGPDPAFDGVGEGRSELGFFGRDDPRLPCAISDEARPAPALRRVFDHGDGARGAAVVLRDDRKDVRADAERPDVRLDRRLPRVGLPDVAPVQNHAADVVDARHHAHLRGVLVQLERAREHDGLRRPFARRPDPPRGRRRVLVVPRTFVRAGDGETDRAAESGGDQDPDEGVALHRGIIAAACMIWEEPRAGGARRAPAGLLGPDPAHHFGEGGRLALHQDADAENAARAPDEETRHEERDAEGGERLPRGRTRRHGDAKRHQHR